MSLLTALWGVVTRLFGGASAAGTVPHGPSMCVATAGATGLALLSGVRHGVGFFVSL